VGGVTHQKGGAVSLLPLEDLHPGDSPFHGHVVVFAGNLSSVGRREAGELVERLGGVVDADVTARTTMLVVGAGGASSAAGAAGAPTTQGSGKSLKVQKAEEANAVTPGRVRILPEEDFCRLGELPSIETLDRQYHSLRQIRERYPAVRDDHLRYLEKWAFVCPVARTKSDRYYGFQDLAVIRQLSEGIEGGASFRVVLRALVAARDGQLTLDFNQRVGEVEQAKVVALTPHRESVDAAQATVTEFSEPSWAQLSLAARYFREGSTLDEGGEDDRKRARTAYRKALLLDPNLVPAVVNLANIHYGLDELVEAQALYERATHLEPECFEAYFNLGNIHHDLGRYLDALEHYRVSLRINPAYADAYFYLAVTLEKIGHSAEAKAHWRSYCELAPDGEWVELAKEFSE